MVRAPYVTIKGKRIPLLPRNSMGVLVVHFIVHFVRSVTRNYHSGGWRRLWNNENKK